jgi:hypothetical protein
MGGQVPSPDDDEDEDEEDKGENWFAGGERRYVQLKHWMVDADEHTVVDYQCRIRIVPQDYLAETW